MLEAPANVNEVKPDMSKDVPFVPFKEKFADGAVILSVPLVIVNVLALVAELLGVKVAKVCELPPRLSVDVPPKVSVLPVAMRLFPPESVRVPAFRVVVPV